MKRRRYGWGWTPVKWQAWLVIGMQIAIIFTAAMFLTVEQPIFELIAFLVILVLTVVTIILLGVISSPSPAWRWGKKPGDNPDEDF